MVCAVRGVWSARCAVRGAWCVVCENAKVKNDAREKSTYARTYERLWCVVCAVCGVGLRGVQRCVVCGVRCVVRNM